MRAKTLAITAVGAVAIATTALAVAPAGAAVTYYYYGYAGGSLIKALDSTITSQLSAESSVFTTSAGATDTNTLASVDARNVVTLGTIKTSAKTVAITGGLEVVATAQAANVNVLNGLITAKAITTTTITKRVNGVSSSTTHSTFANLHIVGITLPVDIPENYTIKVGDIASVGINAGIVATKGDYSVGIGAGLRVTLLKPEGNNGSGAEIDVNPTFTTVAPDSSPSTGHSTLGYAYATRVSAAAGKTISVRSDPTVPTNVFAEGTGGRTLVNTLAAVNLAPVGTIGAVRTTGVGINTSTVASTTTTASIADVNLLGGLIKATAIKVTAHADLSKRTGAMSLANLKIGSTTIPLNAPANTVIDLGVAKVTVNQQIRTAHSIVVRGVDIVLLKPSGSLPVGAEIQLAVASASAF